MSRDTREADVRRANAAFYDAFQRRDLRAMEELWARETEVTCVHPGWLALRGRAAVMKSWQQILGHAGTPEITCSEVLVSLYEDAAAVLCREGVTGQPPALVATNLFRRERGRWCMVHHHASPAPRPPPAGRTLN